MAVRKIWYVLYTAYFRPFLDHYQRLGGTNIFGSEQHWPTDIIPCA